MPTDKITVYYKASGNLEKIIQEFNDYICNSIKQPLIPFPVPASETVYLQESMNVSGEAQNNQVWTFLYHYYEKISHAIVLG